jgi:hypothetical protein
MARPCLSSTGLCTAMTRAGKPCVEPIEFTWTDGPRCVFHSFHPEAILRRREWHRVAGRATGARLSCRACKRFHNQGHQHV